jgi:hypothetical protein
VTASAKAAQGVAVTATTLTPFHHHTYATPSGTATGARFLPDRAMSYALAGAMGALAASPALFAKDYRRDLAALPWLCSMFETASPRLLPPIGKRLNLDTEGGYSKKIQDATGTGNLKTWFFVQEVPQGQRYDGAVFGPDPFAMASTAAGAPVDEIVIRIGRHLGGLVSLRRATNPSPQVRLNAHTAHLLGVDPDADPELGTDVFVLYDIQATRPMAMEAAARRIARLRPDLAA